MAPSPLPRFRCRKKTKEVSVGVTSTVLCYLTCTLWGARRQCFFLCQCLMRLAPTRYRRGSVMNVSWLVAIFFTKVNVQLFLVRPHFMVV